MDAKIKADWVAALRSGKYAQCTGQLREEGSPGDYAYCCLGVLCDVVGARWDDDGQAEYEGGSSGGLLPMPVAKKVGLDIHPNCGNHLESDPVVDVNGDTISLSELNDAGHSFAEIADIIEDQL